MANPGEGDLASELLDRWRGSFGHDYLVRNSATMSVVADSAIVLAEMLSHTTPKPKSILEVGANVGRNLRALRSVSIAELYAVEPNSDACNVLRNDEVLPLANLHQGDIYSLPLPDSSVELVFTFGVLIHVPDESLKVAYNELHRVASRYVLSIEYFSPTPVSVEYRGHEDMLFKRDYGSLWIDWFDDLKHVANGFLWRRTTGQDDFNWWLFEKR